MELIGQKWKLPILWYLADSENQTLRYRELERKVVGITATMLTKCLRELEKDGFITRTQYNTIPPTVEYSLAERGRTLIPALEQHFIINADLFRALCYCQICRNEKDNR